VTPPNAVSRPGLPQGDSKRVAVEAMFDRIAPTYDRTNRVISMGLDQRWRRDALARLRITRGAVVLDIACGTGDLCRDLTALGARPIGIDFSAGMLANARTSAPLVRADALRLPAPDASVDGVVCGFALRNFVDLDAHFREAARVLRPGSRYVALDATVPTNPVVRVGNRVWFAGIVPFIGRIMSRDHDAYRYLPRSTAYLPSRPELADRLRSCGFHEVRVESRLFGSALLLSGTRR